jgi:hypothetical protein
MANGPAFGHQPPVNYSKYYTPDLAVISHWLSFKYYTLKKQTE